MADARTIEDLAMTLIQEQYTILYAKKILPVYNAVKGVVIEQIALSNQGVGYGSRYKEDLKVESLEATAIVHQLEGIFTEIGKERDNMHSIYDAVLYFVCKDAEGSRTGELMQKSVESVKDMVKRLREIVDGCIGTENKNYGLNTILVEIDDVDTMKLFESLNGMINDPSTTRDLLACDFYEALNYLAKRDIKL